MFIHKRLKNFSFRIVFLSLDRCSIPFLESKYDVLPNIQKECFELSHAQKLCDFENFTKEKQNIVNKKHL